MQIGLLCFLLICLVESFTFRASDIHFNYSSPFCSKSSSIAIGFLSPFNSGNVHSLTGAQAAMGCLQAVDDLNSQSSILPNHCLSIVFASTDSDPGRAIKSSAMFAESYPVKVAVLLGEYQSTITQQIAYVTREYHLPQIAYSSTAPDLSNKDVFPTFSRVVPGVLLLSLLLLSSLCSLLSSFLSSFPLLVVCVGRRSGAVLLFFVSILFFRCFFPAGMHNVSREQMWRRWVPEWRICAITSIGNAWASFSLPTPSPWFVLLPFQSSFTTYNPFFVFISLLASFLFSLSLFLFPCLSVSVCTHTSHSFSAILFASLRVFNSNSKSKSKPIQSILGVRIVFPIHNAGSGILDSSGGDIWCEQ